MHAYEAFVGDSAFCYGPVVFHQLCLTPALTPTLSCRGSCAQNGSPIIQLAPDHYFLNCNDLANIQLKPLSGMLRTGAISTLQLRGLFTEAGHRGTTAVICSCSSRLSQRRLRCGHTTAAMTQRYSKQPGPEQIGWFLCRPRGLAAYSNSIQQLRPCRSALLRRSGAQLPGISRCSLSTKGKGNRSSDNACMHGLGLPQHHHGLC